MKPQKYLIRHSEPEAQTLQALTATAPKRDFVLVLPCYDEAPTDIKRIATFCADNNALLILVVNQPEDIENCKNNFAAIEWTNHAIHKSLSATVRLCSIDGTEILLVDRTVQRIPKSQGVGLARKIGADCAYALIQQRYIKYDWIFCTDADAFLPADYFAAPLSYGHGSAVIYPYQHIASGNDAIDQATLLYEKRLHYYIAGLRHAGSPYAFHSLGSTIAIRASYYASAHGFPKRAGGEDFYLLNKVAKLAPVISLTKPEIQLLSRVSHRVPFGTGPAINKLIQNYDHLTDQAIFYHPESFDVLRVWLEFFSYCGHQRYTLGHTTSDWQQWLLLYAGKDNADVLLRVIDSAEFTTTLAKAARQCRDAQAFCRYLHTWFDGFRTLKLLHQLRDLHFPLQNLAACEQWAKATSIPCR